LYLVEGNVKIVEEDSTVISSDGAKQKPWVNFGVARVEGAAVANLFVSSFHQTQAMFGMLWAMMLFSSRYPIALLSMCNIGSVSPTGRILIRILAEAWRRCLEWRASNQKGFGKISMPKT